MSPGAEGGGGDAGDVSRRGGMPGPTGVGAGAGSEDPAGGPKCPPGPPGVRWGAHYARARTHTHTHSILTPRRRRDGCARLSPPLLACAHEFPRVDIIYIQRERERSQDADAYNINIYLYTIVKIVPSQMWAGTGERRGAEEFSRKFTEPRSMPYTVRSNVTEREAREVMASGTSAAPSI